MNSTLPHLDPPPDVVPDPWSSHPPLEGPSWARAATRHEAAAAAGERRRSQMLTEQYGGEQQTLAQYAYEEAVRRGELRVIRQRMERLRDRQDADRPLVRDGFIGFAGAFAPVALLVNGSQLAGNVRKAAYLAGMAGAAYAATEWMRASHERRRAQIEDDLDRCEARAACKSVPQPPPPRSILSQLLSGGVG
ncbi:MAG: hypothetical protein EXR69_05575 [Myxococcales bacterium]|nr:hypothetical protein [Myxococcales bacterium]